MTIRSHIDAAALNSRLNHFQRGVEEAPEGSFIDAKAIAEVFDDAMRALHNNLATGLAAHGLKVSNCDAFREIEAVAYGMLLRANEDATIFLATEGFGEHVDGPAGRRILANAERNRDFLRAAGIIPQ